MLGSLGGAVKGHVSNAVEKVSGKVGRGNGSRSGSSGDGGSNNSSSNINKSCI